MAARLAQGFPAVENTTAYVSACRSLGFTGVTDDALREQYGTEDGLDLVALQSDSDALTRAAAAADDAARLQASLTARLAGAWSGTGGTSAHDVLLRQAAAADATSGALHDAAAATSTLRDSLWAAVDAKVDAVLDVDDRPAAERGEWLDAARTVTSGGGDLAAASELVDQRVKPFVDNDIGAELLTEMRASFDRVTSAFDEAIARLEGCPSVPFDPPAGGTVPAAATAAAPAPAPAVPPMDPVAPVAPVAPPVPAPAALGGMGEGGMPSLGSGMTGLSGLSGFGQQLADLIGGFTGGGLQDDPGLGLGEEFDDQFDDEEPDLDEEDEPEDEPAEELEPVDEPAEDPVAEDPPAAEPPVDEPPAEVLPPPPAVTEPPPPPPPLPPAVPEALPAEKTACEIAAEELPSVGE
ncbi:hypothetical protein [Mycolicibacterium sediminis]|uniref:hypothetical protein n=1 Tax=Mycolicibacterium sediminis TaxID=1286180 RepID=UPI0013CF93FC|nr:hypothetical protein [Mycolicibacterium sediminis]